MTQNFFDGADKLIWCKRFQDILLGPCTQSCLDFRFLTFGRQEDDRNILGRIDLFQAAAGFVPRHARHPNVHQDEIKGVLLRRFDEPPALRFGLPADEPRWTRLEAALADCLNTPMEP